MSLTLDYSSIFERSPDKDRSKNQSIRNKLLSLDDLRSHRHKFEEAHTALSKDRKEGKLYFWELPFDNKMIDEIVDYASDSLERFDDFVQLGIGGSALGAIALHSALNHPQHNLLEKQRRSGCRFFCPDNIDPDLIQSVFDVVNPAKTLFHVVSKSGSTAETISQFMLTVSTLKEVLGSNWNNNLVITTDPDNGFLRKFAEENHIKNFSVDPRVGGRFTVLSPVGLLPAAITGIDIRAVCAGAAQVSESCFEKDLFSNLPALFALILFLSDTTLDRRINVLFAYSNRLFPISDWFRQLWAESLGKKNDLNGNTVFTGPTPVKAIGATDQHSQVQLYVEGPNDKVVIFLGTKNLGRKLEIPDIGVKASELDYLVDSEFGQLLNAERKATAFALQQAERLNMTLEIDKIDPEHIGALFYIFEAAVLYAGHYYNVNSLDQPGVEAGKQATYALMGRRGYSAKRKEIMVSDAGERYCLRVKI